MLPLDPAILQFDYEWIQGDRNKAILIAKEFINLYRLPLSLVYEKYTREELVHEVEELRKCGASRHHDRIVTDMWLLSEYPLGQITGEAHVVVKIPMSQARSKTDGSL